MKNIKQQKGILIFSVLIFAGLVTTLLSVLVGWFVISFRTSTTLSEKTQALYLADAGIEYYRWHLAHDQDDYEDGTEEPGPYEHDVFNASGTKIGEFALSIVPPDPGSTFVTIYSTGTLESASRTSALRAHFQIPSINSYEFLTGSNVEFGSSEETKGRVHSNDGIRFDGIAKNIISSSRESYDDPSHSGASEWAVHTHQSISDNAYPTPYDRREDVFKTGREINMPAVDFEGTTVDLRDIYEKTLANGINIGPSKGLGYRIVIKINDTFDLYEVDSLIVPHWSCNNVNDEDGWGSWSIDSDTLVGNYNFPESGLIFVEDNVWIEGTVSSAHLTIAAGSFPDIPSERKNIIINDDVSYSSEDGASGLALLSQNNINIGLKSQTDLEIDGLLFAEHGRVGRYYYRDSWSHTSGTVIGCYSDDTKSTITLYGTIASNGPYGFSFDDDTGYGIINRKYDLNLFKNPPPELPFVAEDYEMTSWKLLK